MAVVTKKSKVPLLLSILSITLLIGAATLGYMYWRERNKVDDLNNQISELQEQVPLTAEEEVARLVEEVGRLYELPSDETPVIATVEDITKFDNQPFFANAQNGDKLLIFNEAGWAFLYRPSTGKLVNSGPTAEDNTTTNSPAETEETPASSEEPEEVAD